MTFEQQTTARTGAARPPATRSPVTQLLLLDGFRLIRNDVPIEVPRGLQRVIALLALRPGTTRAQLGGLLWPDSSEPRALSSLRTAIWRLRREEICELHTVSDTVRLGRSVEIDVDRLVRIATEVSHGADPDEAARILTPGRHDLLPGWYEEWVLLERERIRQLRLHALEEIASRRLRAGRYGAALQAAIEALRAEPLRETPHRLIVQIHLAEGNVSEALQAFYVYRDLIRRDLQLEPSATMAALLEPILARLSEPEPRPAPPEPRPAPPSPRRPG